MAEKKIKIPPALAGGGVLIVVIGLLVVATAMSGVTVVEPEEVAVIKNNLTGTETVQLSNGTVIHLPFGLTQVYKIDKTQQMIRMTARSDRGDRPGDDSVQIKTNDGSNVNMDVEVQYQIIPEKVSEIVKEIGRGNQYKLGLVRSYARSIIRDELGKLSVVEIADPTNRKEKLLLAQKELNDQLDKYGLKVTLISATDPIFNVDYERVIRERKEADQDVRNQKSAQELALQEQKQSIAEAERIKRVAYRKSEGEMAAQVIAAKADAEKNVQRANGEAYAVKKKGEQVLIESQNEAAAIEVEGLANAKAIRAMADAYEKGGLALVREALAEKFKGVQMEGRPYSLSSQIERLKIEKGAAASAAKGGY